MDWKKLKDNKCPKCGTSTLEHNLRYCRCKCGFMMSVQKFNKIIEYLYRPKQKRCGTFDNFEALQNDGRKELLPDFGDSPFADREDQLEEEE